MNQLLKILILEDNEADYYMVRHELKKAGLVFESKQVQDREGFIEALRSFQPDVILSDHSLFQFNSTDAFELCKQMHLYCPFILVTGTVSEEFAVDALKRGIDDYVLKSNLIRLPSAVNAALRKKKIEEERNQALDNLKESEKHYRTIIENTSDLIIMLTSDMTILYVNPAVKPILGYTKQEVNNQSLMQFVHPEDESFLSKVVRNGFRKNKTESVVFRFRNKEGSWCYLETIGTLDNDGNRMIMNSRDITARKLMEEQLKSQNIELEKINKELDSFVYSASHDLRAPLKSVLGLIKLTQFEIVKTESNQYMVDYLTMMEKSINKLDDTIKSIIYHSRNERSEILIEKIDFQQIIEETLDNLQYLSKETKVKTEIFVNEDWPFLNDKSRIQVLMNNLLSNAFKYIKRTGETPEVKIEIHSDANRAIITIEDNGIGIQEEYLPKIFEMFYRATEMSEGSGLGLYIVSEVIRKLNGTIDVKSEYGKGTKFFIVLPNNLA